MTLSPDSFPQNKLNLEKAEVAGIYAEEVGEAEGTVETRWEHSMLAVKVPPSDLFWLLFVKPDTTLECIFFVDGVQTAGSSRDDTLAQDSSLQIPIMLDSPTLLFACMAWGRLAIL